MRVCVLLYLLFIIIVLLICLVAFMDIPDYTSNSGASNFFDGELSSLSVYPVALTELLS